MTPEYLKKIRQGGEIFALRQSLEATIKALRCEADTAQNAPTRALPSHFSTMSAKLADARDLWGELNQLEIDSRAP